MLAQVRDIEEDRFLFLPTSISILVLRADLSEINLPPNDVQFGVGIELRSIDSIWLVLYCFQEGEDAEGHIQVCESGRIVLDCLADVRREGIVQRSDGQITEILFNYYRLNDVLSFEAIVSGPNGHEELQALDFLLGQYAIKENIIDRELFVSHHDEDSSDHNNIVAKGFENSGVVVRRVLKTSGEYTGHLIRFLGRKFTEATVTPTTTPISAEDIDPRLLAEAQRRREWAEGFNSGARTLTSTILYPVRWTGQKAAKLAQVDHHLDHNLDARERNLVTHQQRQSVTSSTAHGLKKALWDTVEGMGNGVTSMFKGVTEAMSEVGSAIGDSAMHHARIKYGDHYANFVTKSYVDAASEIGLAGYKVANVLSFGIAGLMIDVVVEGSTLLVSLYDYLVGPVILQGYVTLVQPPLLSPKKFFVVLRPWSLSFYLSPKDIVHKPYKIVPTFLLDTIPRLRLRKPSETSTNSNTSNEDLNDLFVSEDSTDSHSNLVRIIRPAPEPFIANAVSSTVDTNESEVNIIEADGLSYIMLAPAEVTNTSAVIAEPSSSCGNSNLETRIVDSHDTAGITSRETPANVSSSNRLSSALYHWSGGHRSHIELTTIDCSTYLLYPEVTFPTFNSDLLVEETALLLKWYEELEIAVRRVETLARRRTEAIELAYLKRLKSLPKAYRLEIAPKRFFFLDHTVPSEGATSSSIASANAAAVTDTVGTEAENLAPMGMNSVARNGLCSMDSLIGSEDGEISPTPATNQPVSKIVKQQAHPAAVEDECFDPIIYSAELQHDYGLRDKFAAQDQMQRAEMLRALQTQFDPNSNAAELPATNTASRTTTDPFAALTQGNVVNIPQEVVQKNVTDIKNMQNGSWWWSWNKHHSAKKRKHAHCVTVSCTPVVHKDLVLHDESKYSSSLPVRSLSDQLDALRVLLINNSAQTLGDTNFAQLQAHVEQYEKLDGGKETVDWQYQIYLQWMGIYPEDAATGKHVLQFGEKYDLFATDSHAHHGYDMSSDQKRLDFTLFSSAASLTAAITNASSPIAESPRQPKQVLGSASLSFSDLKISLPSSSSDATPEAEVWIPVMDAGKGKQVGNLLVSYRVVFASANN